MDRIKGENAEDGSSVQGQRANIVMEIETEESMSGKLLFSERGREKHQELKNSF